MSRLLAVLLLSGSCFAQIINSSGGGFTPPVVATQSANGADLLKCIRATDTAETGNCFKIVNAANNTTLLTLDVDGNIVANSIQLPNNQSVIFKDTGGTNRNALQYDSSDILNLYNAKNNGQINIHGNGVVNVGTDNNNATVIFNNGLSTIRCREFDTGNQLNGCGIGSNFTTDAQIIRTLTLFDKIGAAAHTQMAIVAAGGDSPTVDRLYEQCANSDPTCAAPVYSMTANGASDNYLGTPNAGVGIVPVKGVISSTGQTAAITTATLCTSTNCPAGQYEVDVYLASTVTCATPGPAVTAVSLTWTDDAGTKTAQAVPLDVNGGVSLGANMALGNTTNSAVGHTTFWVASGTTQYATTYTACTSGTGTYSLRIAMRRLL